MPETTTLDSGTVTWTITNQSAGAVATGANGYVQFVASAVAVLHKAITVLPSPQRVNVVDGHMDPIDLPVNDPEVWNWRVEPHVGVDWPPFYVDVPEDGIDLSSGAITPGKGPVRVMQGPQGGSVVGAEDLGDGTIRFVLDDGTKTGPVPATRGPAGPANVLEVGTVSSGPEPVVSLTGVAPKQRINLVLPKGDQGDQGVEGPRGIGIPDGEPEGQVVTGTGSATRWADPVTLIDPATPTAHGLLSSQDKTTLDTYRVGPENTIAGSGAGQNADASATMESSGDAGGYELVLVGPGAGAANTRGWKNTAVGSAAMRDNVDGYFNVAIGNSAMERTVGGVGDAAKSDNDPGARNTAVGSNALRYNETGRGNTAIGRNSAHSSLTGSYITAVGTNAYSGTVDGDIHSAKSADYVTAVGYDAAFYTDAPDCTAVGARALYLSKEKESYGGAAFGNRALENSEARENTGLGNKAGQFITSGRFNIAVGPRALGAESAGVTGASNIAMGAAAASKITSGQYNVAIGQEGMNGLVTGSFNTALGHQANSGMAANVEGGTALGAGAKANHKNAVALGRNAATTAADQVTIGRRHLEFPEAYGAPAIPLDAVRLWCGKSGDQHHLYVTMPDGSTVTLA